MQAISVYSLCMKTLLYTTFLIVTISSVNAQTESLRQKNFNVKKNLALEGYDPVSYFDGEPKEGDEKYTISHMGITYYFVSSNNFSKFKSNPEKYEPAYGGWCAYAMGATGEKVKVDPETYKIINGKLYLFYNFWGNNTLKDWNEKEKVLKEKGDANWKNFIR